MHRFVSIDPLISNAKQPFKRSEVGIDIVLHLIWFTAFLLYMFYWGVTQIQTFQDSPPTIRTTQYKLMPINRIPTIDYTQILAVHINPSLYHYSGSTVQGSVQTESVFNVKLGNIGTSLSVHGRLCVGDNYEQCITESTCYDIINPSLQLLKSTNLWNLQSSLGASPGNIKFLSDDPTFRADFYWTVRNFTLIPGYWYIIPLCFPNSIALTQEMTNTTSSLSILQSYIQSPIADVYSIADETGSNVNYLIQWVYAEKQHLDLHFSNTVTHAKDENFFAKFPQSPVRRDLQIQYVYPQQEPVGYDFSALWLWNPFQYQLIEQTKVNWVKDYFSAIGGTASSVLFLATISLAAAKWAIQKCLGENSSIGSQFFAANIPADCTTTDKEEEGKTYNNPRSVHIEMEQAAKVPLANQ